ncbi:MAG: ATP-binding protein [Oscillospiraceae bacterium]|nr:ATP-binding protein [Oscillospiraceae bacterium]
MILREEYLAAIRPFIDTPLVKILTGIRRCGKSTIFLMLHDELLKRGAAEKAVISRRYTDMDLEGFDQRAMYDDLKTAIAGKGRCYLLLDEVQEIKGWERVVNSLLESADVDIYVTGSNSKLMSSEISTYLTGRYVPISIYTLSFREYLDFKQNSGRSRSELLADYIRTGGFPLVALGNYDDQTAYQIVEGIYHTVVSRDIVKRHSISRQDLFDRVVRFVIENMGRTFSANAITTFLKSEHRTVSVETIYNYLRWLEQAFIIYPCKRYDLHGKAVLKTQEKYYLADVSLKYALYGYNGRMRAAALENIIYLELRRRGYEVYIGKLGNKEIDFIAEKRGERIYVQACVTIPEDSTRETDNLLEIPDNYPKYVVTLDRLAVGNENGVRIVCLEDFLLADVW